MPAVSATVVIVTGSSQIGRIAYSHEAKALQVTFLRGKELGDTYQYYDVPADAWEAFRASESKGAHLNRVIKPAGYTYRKLDPAKDVVWS